MAFSHFCAASILIILAAVGTVDGFAIQTRSTSVADTAVNGTDAQEGRALFGRSNGNQCRGTDLNDKKTHFCQPEEGAGTYHNRDFEAVFDPPVFVIDDKCYFYNGKCFNLDMMICTDLTPCLKWGPHAYVGKVVLPVGAKLNTYEDWSCTSRFSRQLEGQWESGSLTDVKSHDIWVFNDRVVAFKLTLKPGYTCNAGLITKVPGPPCAPEDNIQSTWVAQTQTTQGSPKKISVQYGNTRSESDTRSEGFATSFGLKASAGVDVGITMEVEASAEFQTTYGKQVERATSHSIMHGEEQTLDGDHMWWVWEATGSPNRYCESQEPVTVYLGSYTATLDRSHTPCCVPTFFRAGKESDCTTDCCIAGSPDYCAARLPPVTSNRDAYLKQETGCLTCSCSMNSGGYWGTYSGCGPEFAAYGPMTCYDDWTFRQHGNCPAGTMTRNSCNICSCSTNSGGHWGTYSGCGPGFSAYGPMTCYDDWTFRQHGSC